MTRNDLKRLIKEAIQEVLKEEDYDEYRDRYGKKGHGLGPIDEPPTSYKPTGLGSKYRSIPSKLYYPVYLIFNVPQEQEELAVEPPFKPKNSPGLMRIDDQGEINDLVNNAKEADPERYKDLNLKAPVFYMNKPVNGFYGMEKATYEKVKSEFGEPLELDRNIKS